MQPFDLYLPTRLLFGPGRLTELPALLAPFGRRVLFAYGGGSIKKSGLYDRVRQCLTGVDVVELPGIEPNPKIASVRQGVTLCKNHRVDVILAVGGGSVIDACKNIAAGACYPGDPWDLVLDGSKISAALPLAAVLTLAATGSEYDSSGVISNPETAEKLPISSPLLFPKFSICDPTYTYSVPPEQTAAGAADIISHVFEQYLVMSGNPVTDAMCESVLRTVIKYAPQAMRQPHDAEARAQLMAVSSLGCCGLLAAGRTSSPWPCHALEHELSAYYDITHGAGLAIVTPAWMRYSLNDTTAARFATLGVKVFDLDPGRPSQDTAREAIARTAEFFSAELGLPQRLRDVGIDDTHFAAMAQHIGKHWFGDLTQALRPLSADDLVQILRDAL